MLADFYIPRLSNDMNIAVQKNHLVGQILYRSLEKQRLLGFSINMFRLFLVVKNLYDSDPQKDHFFGCSKS